MKLYLVAFGKLRAPGLREATDYYLRNLGAWTKPEEIELKPIAVPDKSPATRAQIQGKEEQLLLEKLSVLLSPRGKFYLLDETGKPRSTQDWARLARESEDLGVPELAFCIGSSLGFSAELKRRAHGLIALGPQTSSHEIARLVVAEQLYRAWSVIRGHPYHNEG